VLGEAASSLPNRMHALSADNIEISKINALDALERKKATNFYALKFSKPLQVCLKSATGSVTKHKAASKRLALGHTEPAH